METETSINLFNTLLKESIELENVIIDDDNDVCLITGEKLNKNFVTLSCNHTFNYEPLFYEIKQWKSNRKNISYCMHNNIFIKRQIICPYCRQVTNGLLPYYSCLNGVNYPKKWCVNWPKRHWIFPNKCKYIFASGKKKGKKCNKGCLNLFCKGHEKHSHKYDKQGNLKIISKTLNNVNPLKCTHVLLRGKRKDESCAKKANIYKKNGDEQEYIYCSTHVKKYNHPEPLIKV